VKFQQIEEDIKRMSANELEELFYLVVYGEEEGGRK
jgi:hypothetical protein